MVFIHFQILAVDFSDISGFIIIIINQIRLIFLMHE